MGFEPLTIVDPKQALAFEPKHPFHYCVTRPPGNGGSVLFGRDPRRGTSVGRRCLAPWPSPGAFRPLLRPAHVVLAVELLPTVPGALRQAVGKSALGCRGADCAASGGRNDRLTGAVGTFAVLPRMLRGLVDRFYGQPSFWCEVNPSLNSSCLSHGMWM